MASNYFDVQTTRRLAVALLGATGALFFKAIDLVGAANLSGQVSYAEQISASLHPLASGFLVGLIVPGCCRARRPPETPAAGHPHSKPNYLQTAFALLVVSGLFHLIWGGWSLLSGVRTLPASI